MHLPIVVSSTYDAIVLSTPSSSLRGFPNIKNNKTPTRATANWNRQTLHRRSKCWSSTSTIFRVWWQTKAVFLSHVYVFENIT